MFGQGQYCQCLVAGPSTCALLVLPVKTGKRLDILVRKPLLYFMPGVLCIGVYRKVKVREKWRRL